MVSRCRATLNPGAYVILPQPNRVTSTIPDFQGTAVQVLAAPEMGARFVQYELIMDPGGGSIEPLTDDLEHFLYVLEGDVSLSVDGTKHALQVGGYAWLAPGTTYHMLNAREEKSRVLWLRRRHIQNRRWSTPKAFVSHEQQVPALPEDTYLEQHLIPYENPAFDMGVNLLNFEPGIYFGFVESHIMEHGLYMLAGRGVYWLNGDFHEVQANDFIYMAPYCPQFFYATGWEKGRYLVYKDVNRDYTISL